MTALLPHLDETGGFESLFYLAKAERPKSGLSRPNFHLDVPDRRRMCCDRGLEIQFQRFTKIGEGFVFSFALTCQIDLKALRYKPVPLTPDRRCERTLHSSILPQAGPP